MPQAAQTATAADPERSAARTDTGLLVWGHGHVNYLCSVGN